MPNPEKEAAKDKLKSKLLEKQDARRPKIESDNNDRSSNSNSNSRSGSSGGNKGKVLKKPPPNF
jgi:hypothetical protein